MNTHYTLAVRTLIVALLMSAAGALYAQDYRYIENRWKRDQFLNIEQGAIVASPIERGWWSAQWTIEPVAGAPYVRLRNRWKPDQFLHIENGSLQSGPIESGWWSAMWTLEPGEENSVRIRNRWKGEQYLHVEYGRVQAGPIERGWWSAQWFFPLAR